LNKQTRDKVIGEIKELFRRAKKEEGEAHYDEKYLESLHFSNAT
jgi:hypothetical protein